MWIRSQSKLEKVSQIDSVEAIVRKISNVMWEWAAVCDKDTSLSSFVRPCPSAPVMPASFSPTSSTSPPYFCFYSHLLVQDRTTSLRYFRHQFQFQFQFFGLDNSTRPPLVRIEQSSSSSSTSEQSSSSSPSEQEQVSPPSTISKNRDNMWVHVNLLWYAQF